MALISRSFLGAVVALGSVYRCAVASYVKLNTEAYLKETSVRSQKSLAERKSISTPAKSQKGALLAHVRPTGEIADSGVRAQKSVVLQTAPNNTEKFDILNAARSKVCDTFPGNICDSVIKGARASPEWLSSNQGLPLDKGWLSSSQVRASLRRKMASGEPFVFAAFGSSVTAGHDNHINTSWPFELERILKPTFEKMGFGFEVRQRAVGGWHEAPFSAGCMQNRAGSGVDALSWEWTMYQDSTCLLESFMREAYSLNGDHAAPPIVISLEHTISSIKLLRTGVDDKQAAALRNASFKCLDLEGPLFKRRWQPNQWYLSDEFISREELSNFERQLASPSAALLAKGTRAEDLVISWEEEQAVLTGMKPSAAQKAAMDAAAEAIAKKQRPIPWLIQNGAVKPFMEAGFGFESFAATTGIDQVPQEWQSWYVAREKAFNVNWHPGPLGHLLIASQLAHFFLEQAGLALEEGPRDVPLPVIPPPTACGAGVPRSCATGMAPHDGPDIKSLVIDGHGWSKELSVDQVNARFSMDLRKPIRLNASGKIVLKVQAKQKGDVAVVCMAPCVWTSCGEHKGFVGAGPARYWPPRRAGAPNTNAKPAVSDVNFVLHGTRVPEGKLLEMNDKVFGARGSYCAGCNTTLELCQAVGELNAIGSHLLRMTVAPKTDPNDKNMFIEILQVMVVPGPNSV